MTELTALDRQNIWHPFTPMQGVGDNPLITRASGVYLHTEDGRAILDAVSSWWVNLHGHSNAYIAKAIADQATTLEHVIFAGFTHEPAIQLSANLLSVLPADQNKLFFSDNGSTAVEVALKLAIQYWHNLGVSKKKVIAIQGAYHGDTFGAMSVAERGLFTRPFHSRLFETSFISFPGEGTQAEALREMQALADSGDVAAFIFEPLVQAASGMRMYEAGALDQLLGYAKKAGIITIADEVFTGFGRTGKLFAIDHLENKPDIIALSKGITGGFMPLGVTTCNKKIAEAFESASFEKTFFHGHSYTANPLACAAANASFKLLMDDACQKRIAEITRHHQRFANNVGIRRGVRSARTLGTILAIELETREETTYVNSIRSRIYPFFMERNILLRPLGNVLYILPPYVITPAELDQIYGAIESFLDWLESTNDSPDLAEMAKV